MQEVSHSHHLWKIHNEITQFAFKLWFYDPIWLTSTNILKQAEGWRVGGEGWGVMQEVSHGIFSQRKKSKIILLLPIFMK